MNKNTIGMLSLAGAIAAECHDTPYAAPYPGLRRIMGRSRRQIEHQATCPTCGRTMVNVYKREGAWKCKACWDAEGKEE